MLAIFNSFAGEWKLNLVIRCENQVKSLRNSSLVPGDSNSIAVLPYCTNAELHIKPNLISSLFNSISSFMEQKWYYLTHS